MSVDRPFVFLCYPHEQTAIAEALAAFLSDHLVTVWFDRYIPAGVDWRKELHKRLDGCGALIVLVAPEVPDLTWLKREIGMARELGKPIFPVLLPGAGEDERRKLGIRRIQAFRLVDDRPARELASAVHDALYTAQPEPGGPQPGQVRPDRVRPRRAGPGRARPGRNRPRRRTLAAAAGAGLVAVLALGWLGVWLAGTSEPESPGGCAGRPAHIDAVSTVSPGHTGHTPQITVSVCTPAAAGHHYWLMDYTTSTDGRRFYAKAAVAGTSSYRVTHSQATGESTPRTYLVVDVPPDLADQVARQWTNPDSAPLVSPGTHLPTGVTLISNEVPAVL